VAPQRVVLVRNSVVAGGRTEVIVSVMEDVWRVCVWVI